MKINKLMVIRRIITLTLAFVSLYFSRNILTYVIFYNHNNPSPSRDWEIIGVLLLLLGAILIIETILPKFFTSWLKKKPQRIKRIKTFDLRQVDFADQSKLRR